MRDIMAATALPVLVDGDDGYGDVKNVTRTIAATRRWARRRSSSRTRCAPKRCGHMAGKDVIDAGRDGAQAARGRRGAAQPRHLPDRAHRRARGARPRRGAAPRRALPAGRRRRPVRRGAAERGRAARASAARLRACRSSPTCSRAAAARRCCRRPSSSRLGFAMVAYPTSLMFRVARTIERALAD